MTRSAINIQNLSKEYQIKKGTSKEIFKALNGINLEFEAGKVTGLIGANGAGKSTLLKILSRITLPSSGTAQINGRLASLLEVGTGFHPELSGRENVYLNGALLGMKKSEIKSQFDEIVDFSGVENFLDTPVKHYSSGMYVRLAFSVAAHLQSEVLLIDEVLAVGDAEFQRKCIAKMDEATSSQNRTVIFVSHNMSVARSLCQDIVYLEKGQVKMIGDAKSVTEQYQSEMSSKADVVSIGERKDRGGSGELRFTELKLTHTKSQKENILITGEEAKINLSIKSLKPSVAHDLDLELNVFNAAGNFLTTLSNKFIGTDLKQNSKEESFECIIANLPLMAGKYYLRAKIMLNGFPVDLVDHALHFEVLVGDYYGNGNFKQRATPGVYIDHHWKSQ